MAMTQIAFLSKADLPTNGQVQLAIRDLGYEFKIRGNKEACFEIVTRRIMCGTTVLKKDGARSRIAIFFPSD